MKRQLTQQEIDAVFLKDTTMPLGNTGAPVFDFRRPDRIPKSQLRAIHLLHENFVRSAVSSLSAYLRTYIVMNLVSVEQISYAEFVEGLPSPTCMASVGLKPYDGNAVLEINPSLVFPILEMLLGATGTAYANIQREITEIEQTLMDGLLKIILQDLREAWRSVSLIEFSIQMIDTEPQLLQVLAPNEAVVAIGIEMRIGDNAGLLNIAMPSLMIKMMRSKFDQQWSTRKEDPTLEEQRRVLNLLQTSRLQLEAELHGSKLQTRDLMRLSVGDVLSLDHPVDRPLYCAINGSLRFSGRIGSRGRKRALVFDQLLSG